MLRPKKKNPKDAMKNTRSFYDEAYVDLNTKSADETIALLEEKYKIDKEQIGIDGQDDKEKDLGEELKNRAGYHLPSKEFVVEYHRRSEKESKKQRTRENKDFKDMYGFDPTTGKEVAQEKKKSKGKMPEKRTPKNNLTAKAVRSYREGR